MLKDSDELFLSYCDSPDKRGDVGEVITVQALRNELGMKVLRNVYLPYRGRTTEVDIIGFSQHGVFIIENKNYSGRVTGRVNSHYWKVTYPTCQELLYNPILQNTLHRDCAESLLTKLCIEDVPLFKPVIFNCKASLNIIGGEKSVFKLDDFVEKYKSINKPFSISQDTADMLYDIFSEYSNQSDEAKILHRYGLMKVGENFARN